MRGYRGERILRLFLFYSRCYIVEVVRILCLEYDEGRIGVRIFCFVKAYFFGELLVFRGGIYFCLMELVCLYYFGGLGIYSIMTEILCRLVEVFLG